MDRYTPELIHIMDGRKLLRRDQETTQRLNTSQNPHTMRTVQVPTSTRSAEISLYPKQPAEPSQGFTVLRLHHSQRPLGICCNKCEGPA